MRWMMHAVFSNSSLMRLNGIATFNATKVLSESFVEIPECHSKLNVDCAIVGFYHARNSLSTRRSTQGEIRTLPKQACAAFISPPLPPLQHRTKSADHDALPRCGCARHSHAPCFLPLP